MHELNAACKIRSSFRKTMVAHVTAYVVDAAWCLRTRTWLHMSLHRLLMLHDACARARARMERVQVCLYLRIWAYLYVSTCMLLVRYTRKVAYAQTRTSLSTWFYCVCRHVVECVRARPHVSFPFAYVFVGTLLSVCVRVHMYHFLLLMSLLKFPAICIQRFMKIGFNSFWDAFFFASALRTNVDN